MHVDGFRFDLAASLGRGGERLRRHIRPFLEAVARIPVLAKVKLIAEPWDIGWPTRSGQFPAGWSEWNGKYRDTVRDFWRATAGTLPDFATRISGSRDLYGHGGRRPTASVNIITVPRRLHDGRPRQLRRQAQRGQRRGQPRRHRRQPQLELRRRGRRPTTPPCSSCAPASAAT